MPSCEALSNVIAEKVEEVAWLRTMLATRPDIGFGELRTAKEELAHLLPQLRTCTLPKRAG